MSAYVVGIVRSALSLDALTLEVLPPLDAAAPWQIEHAVALRPLATHPDLSTAWRALESVTSWDETTLGHVLTILRSTVPCADAPPELPAIGPEVHEQPEPRATAAHPRAFRGTKYRPPRREQPAAVDLRPYLLTRRHTDLVLEQLGQPRGIDPYVAWNHRVDATANFDPMFVMHLLPLFKDCAWSDVGAFAALARSLQLHRDSVLRSALASVYVAAGDPPRALGWWRHVLAQDPAHRVAAANLVSTSGIAKISPVEPHVAALVGQLPAVQQWSCFRGLVGGASPAYLESGIQLGAISSTTIADPPPGRSDVTALVETTVERLGEAMDEDSGAAFWRTHLWTLCGHQPELTGLLARHTFTSLHPEAAFQVIRLASLSRWRPETAEAEWNVLSPRLAVLVEIVERLAPEYQRKVIEDMREVYAWAIDVGHDVVGALASCLDLCLRVAKPPFSTDAVLGEILPYLATVLASHRARRCATAPDASWLALEDACKRSNNLRLLSRGIACLGSVVPDLLVSAFATHPGALFQTADQLAAVQFATAYSVLHDYERSPLADTDLADAPLDKLCELITPIAQAGGPNPIRRAVRRHLSGEELLSDAQLTSHRERIVANLDVVRLAAIRQGIERFLATRIGAERIETPTIRHAVALLNSAGGNFRQLKRMITATVAGDAEWKLRHPRTQEWLARHPTLDRDRWLAGIETRGHIDGIGEVRLAVEANPLEALKLGTYVGSCLGRGGNLEYSAAAAVLDVNKQVIYARDPRGSVIGRQLLAISEADELVCFAVYGTAKLALLEPLFRDYDRAFAAHLGLPVFGGDSYKIATVLSREWMDDSAWLEAAPR